MSRWQRAPPRRRMMRCLNSSSLRPTPRAIFWRSIYRLRCVSAATSIPTAGIGKLYRGEPAGWYSDVLWSLKTASGEGYIYVVIEHQSSPDAQMAFRLMRYAIAAMQRHLDGGHTKLPLVVPMLFYHGRPRHTVVTQLAGLFADPQLASELYISPFPLVDVTVIPDDEIVRHRRVALLELIQKHIRQRDLMGIVEQLTTILLSGDANDRQLKTLFNYLLQTGNARRFGRFIHEVAQQVPQHRERLMTIAERLQEVGRRKGKREGRLEGRQEGQHAEALRIAQRMLADGIARETVVKITGLTADGSPRWR